MNGWLRRLVSAKILSESGNFEGWLIQQKEKKRLIWWVVLKKIVPLGRIWGIVEN